MFFSVLVIIMIITIIMMIIVATVAKVAIVGIMPNGPPRCDELFCCAQSRDLLIRLRARSPG